MTVNHSFIWQSFTQDRGEKSKNGWESEIFLNSPIEARSKLSGDKTFYLPQIELEKQKTLREKVSFSFAIARNNWMYQNWNVKPKPFIDRGTRQEKYYPGLSNDDILFLMYLEQMGDLNEIQPLNSWIFHIDEKTKMITEDGRWTEEEIGYLGATLVALRRLMNLEFTWGGLQTVYESKGRRKFLENMKRFSNFPQVPFTTSFRLFSNRSGDWFAYEDGELLPSEFTVTEVDSTVGFEDELTYKFRNESGLIDYENRIVERERNDEEKELSDSTKEYIKWIQEIDPLEFSKDKAFENHHLKDFASPLYALIHQSFKFKKFSISKLESIITKFISDMDFFKFEPTKMAIDVRHKQLELEGNDFSNNTYFKEFINKLDIEKNSNGLFENEPYRERGFEIMFSIPLLMRINENFIPQVMPILVGTQGAGKSTFVKNLALGWSDEISSLEENQENVYKRTDNSVVEFPELSGLSKADITGVKAQITKRSASINLKYMNGTTKFIYNALIVGTTNDIDILKDVTGERRFMPLRVDNNIGDITQDDILNVFAEIKGYRKLDKVRNDYLRHLFNESAEDLQFKKSEYAQSDPQLSKLLNWLRLEDTGFFVGASPDGKKARLLTKNQLRSKFIKDQDDAYKGASLRGLYFDKLINHLQITIGYSSKSTVIKKSGKSIRVFEVETEKWLNLKNE